MDAFCKGPSLAFVFDMFQEIFESMDVFHEFRFGRQDVSVLKDVIADPQFFRYPTQVLEVQGLPFAG